MSTENKAKLLRPAMSMRTEDFASVTVGVGAFALGLWMVLDIAWMADNPIASMSGGIDAKQYPTWLGVMLMLLSAIVGSKAVFRLATAQKWHEESMPWGRVFGVIAALFLYVLVFMPLGYIVSTTLFGAALMIAGGSRQTLPIIGFPLILTLALYWIVRLVFDIYLPNGSLFSGWMGI